MSVDGKERLSAAGRAIGRDGFVAAALGWTLLLASLSVVLWIAFGGAARGADPKAAAREIGKAGAAAAGAVARNAASVSKVPGYIGTNVPERTIGAGALDSAGRARLADPDDVGGQAGRSVMEGTLNRPSMPVGANDPIARQGDAVAADPEKPAWRAGGLASGGVTECQAGVEDSEDGGSCGSVRYCVGAGCETVEAKANTGFANSVTRLNMAIEMGEEFDRGDMRFFKGNKRRCHIKWGGLANCCKNTGLLVGLANCSSEEKTLAKARNAGNTHYLGKWCTRRTFLGFCIRRSRHWCVFQSKLGRILQQQGRQQLGIDWSSCRGLTVQEIERIDFARVDFTEFTENLVDGSSDPRVSLPDAGDTGEAMRTKVREFYRRGG